MISLFCSRLVLQYGKKIGDKNMILSGQISWTTFFQYLFHFHCSRTVLSRRLRETLWSVIAAITSDHPRLFLSKQLAGLAAVPLCLSHRSLRPFTCPMWTPLKYIHGQTDDIQMTSRVNNMFGCLVAEKAVISPLASIGNNACRIQHHPPALITTAVQAATPSPLVSDVPTYPSSRSIPPRLRPRSRGVVVYQ